MQCFQVSSLTQELEISIKIKRIPITQSGNDLESCDLQRLYLFPFTPVRRIMCVIIQGCIPAFSSKFIFLDFTLANGSLFQIRNLWECTIENGKNCKIAMNDSLRYFREKSSSNPSTICHYALSIYIIYCTSISIPSIFTIDVTFINNLIRSGNYRERFAKRHMLLSSINTEDFTNSELWRNNTRSLPIANR